MDQTEQRWVEITYQEVDKEYRVVVNRHRHISASIYDDPIVMRRTHDFDAAEVIADLLAAWAGCKVYNVASGQITPAERYQQSLIPPKA